MHMFSLNTIYIYLYNICVYCLLPIAYILLLLLLLGWRLRRLCQVSLPFRHEFSASVFTMFLEHVLQAVNLFVPSVDAITKNEIPSGVGFILGGSPCPSQRFWERHLPQISSAIQRKKGPIARAIRYTWYLPGLVQGRVRSSVFLCLLQHLFYVCKTTFTFFRFGWNILCVCLASFAISATVVVH